jgi:integrase
VGIPKRSVSVGPKRADPRRIPNPTQVRELADRMREVHGGNWDLFVLLGSYCALRSGELFALRTNSFFRRDDGRLMLDVSAQEHRVVAATSDTGATKSRTSPKSVKGHEPRSRRVPVPKELATTLTLRFPNLGQGSQYLFVGPRGAVANYDTVRTWWQKAIAEQFPEGHRLADITPHAMRHAGMSWWFAARFDEAVIQQWGGWSSLKVMLDVYRGVLEDINNMDLAGLDQFEGSWRAIPDAEASKASADPINITLLSEWRKRRA